MSHRRWNPLQWLWEFLVADMYRLGYVAALDDIDRTGLIPKTEETKQRSARRSWERMR